MTEQQAFNSANFMRGHLPFRLHYIFSKDGNRWTEGNSFTMTKPKNLVKKGYQVKLLKTGS
jgi:hypothetical protein